MLKPSWIRSISMLIELIATILVTVEVVIIHYKIQTTGTQATITDQNIHAERILLFTSIALYGLAFAGFLYSDIKERSLSEERIQRLERKHGIS